MSRIDLTKIDWRSIKYCYNILFEYEIMRRESERVRLATVGFMELKDEATELILFE